MPKTSCGNSGISRGVRGSAQDVADAPRDLGGQSPEDDVLRILLLHVLLCLSPCGLHADMSGSYRVCRLGQHVARHGWDNPSRGPQVVCCGGRQLEHG